jgi:hypothetical protein
MRAWATPTVGGNGTEKRRKKTDGLPVLVKKMQLIEEKVH